MEFENLVNERRSARNFLQDQHISREELTEIFNLVKLAPSAFNLQHTKYVVVQDVEMKEQLKQAAFGQYKVSTASAVVLVFGDKEAYKDADNIYEGLHMLSVINKQEYDFLVKDTIDFYESRGTTFMRDEAIRNASISAMLFMMAAKNQGWDTCPMIGFDPDKVKQLLSVSEQFEPVLMITLGKEKVESRRPRGYRKPETEFVTYI